MNKRPLFWAVMCFALGEVLYIVADKGNKISTTLVVLICLAIIYRKLKVKWFKVVVYSLMLMVGFLRISWEDACYPYYKLFGPVEYEIGEAYYGGYSVEHLTAQYGNALCWKDSSDEYGSYSQEYNNLGRYTNINGAGVVEDVTTGGSGYNLTVLINYSETDRGNIGNSYRIILYGIAEKYSIGDCVRVEGELVAFVPRGNPGEFNRGNYYKARGIVGYSFQGAMLVSWVGKDDGLWYRLKSVLYGFRDELEKSLEGICDDDSKGLYSGILLGDKADIPDKDMLLYRMSGIAHIFAISGLHIGIIGGVLYKLLRKFGIRFLPSSILAVGLTVLYGIMTGFSFSTMRAIVMLGLSLLGEVLGRRYDLLTGIGLALGVLLIGQPFRILDGGLLLSFGAVAGVAVSKYIVKLFENIKSFRQLQRKKTRRLYSMVSSVIFAMGINLVTVPLIAYTYFQIPLYGVLLNVIIVPLMSLTVFCGFFGVLLGLVNQFFARLVILPGVWSLKIYQGMCTLFQELPFDVINTGKPHIIELIIYYSVLCVSLICLNPSYISRLRKWIHHRKKKWIPYMQLRIVGCLVAAMAIIIGSAGVITVRCLYDREKVIFLDVGQGDGTLIKTANGTNIVVDTGSTTNDSLGEYVVYPALLAENMGHIDYWFISHLDEDHTSGLEYMLSLEIDVGITIDNIVLSRNVKEFGSDSLIELAIAKGINIIYMQQGDVLTDKSFVIEAVHPGDTFELEDKNEQSLVLSYKTDKISILFTGDIGEQGINAIMKDGIISGRYNILKVPHHGSKYSYSMLFLDKLEAEVAVISCAERNSYGHPHKDMLEGLICSGCDIYRTDNMGAISIYPQ
ncbi:MAG: DNA internalization-related competence protein ComEC/Rec2 [Lachnospiraceae bacterium]|nr:DNA internalization-related competence protein ComEC/Rec2 [Lachnospiraceae bacterium]